LVARFWNGWAKLPALDNLSFGKLAGPTLIEFMAPWIKPGNRCLDYGGGSGHLTSLMIDAGYRTAFFETSTALASLFAASMKCKPEFLGAITSNDRTAFDVVLCTEVIEHVLEQETRHFLAALLQRIAPGGLLILTTPFAEDLAQSEVYCPNCDRHFHRWQHQRSWQLGDVENLMKQQGLETEWLGRVGFDDPHYVRDFHLRRRCGELWPWTDGVVPVIGRGDHIVYIGHKPKEFVSNSYCDGKTHRLIPGRSHGWAPIDRTMLRMLQRVRSNTQARRLQPWFDWRENAIRSTLLSPGEFPFRLPYAIKGRVVLGISTLGSGGAERQVVNTVQGLRSRGVDDVHLLVEHLENAPENAFYLDKARRLAAGVHTVPSEHHGTCSWVLEHPRSREVLTDWLIDRILNAALVIKRLAPEIVQTSLDWTNVTVGLAAVLAGVPKVFMSGRNLTPIHFEFFQWFMYPCYRALAQHPNVRILNNSEAGCRDYARWLGLAPEQITVLRNGLVTSDFPIVDEARRRLARDELDIADETAVVAGAFRLSAEKNPLLWVDTAAEVKKQVPNVVFLLCGTGPMEGEIKARVAALGLDSSFRHLGVRSDIQTIFSAADLVLQTARQEGTPNTLIEAQAMGIPVVTTAAFGAAEAVDHGITGLVVRSDNTEALADTVTSVLQDTRLRTSVRETGPQFIENRFGLERMVDDTLLAYANADVRWALDFLPERLRHRAYIPLCTPWSDNGYAFATRLPDLTAVSDDIDFPERSTLILLEDGLALGPAHAVHDTIRNIGFGAYSHWKGLLYFSTSDNTDPRTNGRQYIAIIPR
jgi:glycosyltransferase involved in cell wall biosynthesis/SAM-dependent methyltransferase